MTTPEQALGAIPAGLRTPLIEEYNTIIRNFMERNWTPSALSGGRFCEIVYTILDGFSSGNYAQTPAKPPNFVSACRALENRSANPRSFQILIPRMLPPLYDIRNNRGVGHVGGDVDSNYIDALAVVSIAGWVMAELVRVFHGLSLDEAQRLVDSLIDRKTPLVWQSGDTKRVLRHDLPLRAQILLLLSSSFTPTKTDDLFKWTECSKRAYLTSILKTLHKTRFIELSSDGTTAELLPPGREFVNEISAKEPISRMSP